MPLRWLAGLSPQAGSCSPQLFYFSLSFATEGVQSGEAAALAFSGFLGAGSVEKIVRRGPRGWGRLERHPPCVWTPGLALTLHMHGPDPRQDTKGFENWMACYPRTQISCENWTTAGTRTHRGQVGTWNLNLTPINRLLRKKFPQDLNNTQSLVIYYISKAQDKIQTCLTCKEPGNCDLFAKEETVNTPTSGWPRCWNYYVLKQLL